MHAWGLGDAAVAVSLGEEIGPELSRRVQALAGELRRRALPGVRDIVPAFTTVTLFYEPGFAPPAEEVAAEAARAAEAAGHGSARPRVMEIPVVYGGEHGPDLEAVASGAGLTAAEVVKRHTGGEYLVHAIGFTPGFAYLGGLPPELATPRRSTPRALVPAGSVGIGGAQTGVYPLASPGGWNLIGRSSAKLFDPTRDESALLRVGDQVRFRAVASAKFESSAPTATADENPSPAAGSGAEHGVEVIRPGMLTTVQDLGRPGHRCEGVASGGAADAFALRVANLLVGNPEEAACVEFTLVGPQVRFRQDTVAAVCGAEVEGVPGWRAFAVAAGETLNLGLLRRGCRGYMAIAGGIDVPTVLGGRGVYLRAGIGGHRGRALRAGDVLPTHATAGARRLRGGGRVDPRILPDYARRKPVRVIPGAHWAEFPDDWLAGEYGVSSRSDRMGVRLEGPALKRRQHRELTSTAVCVGTVQAPPDGQPIVLLADAQTIGGYPQLGHIAAVDWPVLAQLRPGERVKFEPITVEEARALARAREDALAVLRAGLREQWR